MRSQRLRSLENPDFFGRETPTALLALERPAPRLRWDQPPCWALDYLDYGWGYIYIYMYIYIYIYIYLYIRRYISIYTSVYIYIYNWWYIYIYNWWYIYIIDDLLLYDYYWYWDMHGDWNGTLDYSLSNGKSPYLWSTPGVYMYIKDVFTRKYFSKEDIIEKSMFDLL